MLFSSPDLASGSYQVTIGGSSSGQAVDGLYSGGEVSGGTPAGSFTVSSVVTTAGLTGGMFPGGQGGRRPGQP